MTGTIAIPTAELVGILADVIPFASTDPSLPGLNGVYLRWRDGNLEAMATDHLRAAVSWWDEDVAPTETVEEDLFTEWGGDVTDRWGLMLDLGQVKDLVRAFKPKPKRGWAPVRITGRLDQVEVLRDNSGGMSALRMILPAVGGGKFPDVRLALGKINPPKPTRHVAFSAQGLAAFAKVRPTGPLRMHLSGDGKATRITIGPRFEGVIMAQRITADGAVEIGTITPPDDEPAEPEATSGIPSPFTPPLA